VFAGRQSNNKLRSFVAFRVVCPTVQTPTLNTTSGENPGGLPTWLNLKGNREIFHFFLFCFERVFF